MQFLQIYMFCKKNAKNFAETKRVNYLVFKVHI